MYCMPDSFPVFEIPADNIWVIHIGVLIQNAEEVFAVCDPAFVLREVILNERLKGLVSDPLAQVL